MSLISLLPQQTSACYFFVYICSSEIAFMHSEVEVTYLRVTFSKRDVCKMFNSLFHPMHYSLNVRFEVFTAMTMKNGVFWDVRPCGSCQNRRFGGTYQFLRSVRRLLVTASIVPSSPILVTIMKEALGSSETSVLTKVTRHNIPEDTSIHLMFPYV
jgi:hypothetical protein